MRINHNIAALNTHRQLGQANNANQQSMEKLSSGLRINRAGDDAAGLAISEKMRGQIRGLEQAQTNAQDSISLVQTAEGALNETHSILQRMRELAVQSSNDTNTGSDRSEIQKEINQLADEVDRVANTTEFNTKKLLDGSKVGLKDKIDGEVSVQNNSSIANFSASAGDTDNIDVTGTFTITRTTEANGDTTDFSVEDPNGTGASLDAADTVSVGSATLTVSDVVAGMKSGESVTISTKEMETAKTDVSKAVSAQIGANSGQNMLMGFDNMQASALGIRDSATGEAVDVSTAGKASAAVTSINNAIEAVSTERSKMGAYQNRLDHTINNLGTSSENLTAAESRIRDVDMAKEMMNQTKQNILAQASQSMLAKANQQPQGVLQLLR